MLKFFAILQRIFAKFFARAERFAKKIAKINNLQRFLQVFCKENCNFVKLILFCTKLSYILQFAKVFANLQSLRIFANCKQFMQKFGAWRALVWSAGRVIAVSFCNLQ